MTEKKEKSTTNKGSLWKLPISSADKRHFECDEFVQKTWRIAAGIYHRRLTGEKICNLEEEFI